MPGLMQQVDARRSAALSDQLNAHMRSFLVIETQIFTVGTEH
jgi:hypothetical protein